MTDRIERASSAMIETGVNAWLLYNFREANPIAARVLGMPPGVHQTRRWACLITDMGEVRGLVHRIEPHIATYIPGAVQYYSSQKEFEQGLRQLLHSVKQVAMEYSPKNALPVVAKVDAGTIELVRSFGVEVMSSGNVISALEGRLSKEQILSAQHSGVAVREMMMSAFGMIRTRLLAGERVTEFDVKMAIVDDLERRGMVTDHPAICAVGANSANPHYEPTEDRHDVINIGDFVLIDLWGREDSEGSVFGDITWVGYAGEDVPERYATVFTVVRDARNAALQRVRDAFAEGAMVTGAELDDVARNLITSAGYGEYFIHRTGHSITSELHGAGTNIDNFETEDTRPIIAGSSFSIEPGIYLPGDFGVRSELDVVIGADGRVLVPSEPLQQAVIPILRSDW